MATIAEEFQRNWLIWIFGTCILIGGIILLTWNEGRAVHHTYSLEETYNNAISLNPFEKLRPEYNGRVVHISGDLTIDEPLTEPEYGISIQAVKLKRRVQMYQWVEERSPRNDNDDIVSQQKTVDDYYYVTEWRDKLVDSSTFYIRHGHQNPTEIPLKTVTYVSPRARVGPVMLSSEIKEKFIDWVEVTSDERPERSDIKLHMGIYYHCQDIFNPEVGDLRVQFYYAGVAGDSVTIIAKQEDSVLVPYTTSKGHKMALLRSGNLNINQMFAAEHSDARAETWKLRFYGCVLVYFAIICLGRLLKILFSYTPYLTDIISGDATDLYNLLVAVSFSLTVIAFAWIFYRPMIGIALIFTAISPFLYCIVGVYNAAQNGFILRN